MVNKNKKIGQYVKAMDILGVVLSFVQKNSPPKFYVIVELDIWLAI